MNNCSILIFADQFPHGIDSELAFLQNETKLLMESGFRVIAFPRVDPEPKYSTKDIEVNSWLIEHYRNRSKIRTLLFAFTSTIFYKELLSHSFNFWNQNRLFKLIHDIGVAKYLVNNIENEILKYEGNIILYSYWNNEIALSLSLISKKHSRIRAVTRAHNHDLYENHYDYLPCLKSNIENLDFVYCISKDGLIYLTNRFPTYKNKVRLFYLGVNKAIKIPEKKYHDHLKVVSCSYINKNKRVDLIFYGLKKYVDTSNCMVEWIHFGDGPEMKNLEDIIKLEKPMNLIVDLKGFVNNSEILNFYSTDYVDFFITTSENEGLPVSLQEAQAYGIPIIATPVNGIPEIVNETNGLLLSNNPSPEEISDAINRLISKDQISIRSAALNSWTQKFDSNINYKLFIEAFNSLFE